MRAKILFALLVFTALASALLSGPAGFRTEPQSAEAALLSEVKKLLASDAQANGPLGDWFGFSVAVSGDTAVVGAVFEDGGAGHTPSATPARHMSSGATRAARGTGAR